MNELIFETLKVVVMAIFSCVTIYLIPLIREKIGNERLEYIDRWTLNAVMWAEQYLQSKTGAEKKETVMAILRQIRDTKKLDITDDQIEILVESAVMSIKSPSK